MKFIAHIVTGLQCDSDGGSSIKGLITSSWATSLVQAAHPRGVPLLPSLAADWPGTGIWHLASQRPSPTPLWSALPGTSWPACLALELLGGMLG